MTVPGAPYGVPPYAVPPYAGAPPTGGGPPTISVEATATAVVTSSASAYVVLPPPLPVPGPSGLHDYEVIVCDKYGIAQGQIVSAVPTQIDWVLNDIGQALIDFYILDPSSLILPLDDLPGALEIQIWRDQVLIWWGWPTSCTYDAKQVHLTCAGLLFPFSKTSFGPVTTNYLVNPSFELPGGLGVIPGWTAVGVTSGTVGVTPDTAPVLGSQQAELIQAGAGTDTYLQQFIPFTSSPIGDLFDVSAWCYISPNATFAPALEQRGLFVQFIAALTVTAGPAIQQITADTGAGQWVRLDVQVEVPPNQTGVLEVRLYAPQGVIYWDACRATIPESVGSPLQGADVQFIMEEIVRYVNDPTRGKNDKAIPFAGPATGQVLIRDYQLADNAGCLDALNEFPTIGVCFPGETEVAAPDLLDASRRWYNGELVEITTANGHKLAGTPNHPVLTDEGWVPLHALGVGDYVISDSRAEVVGRVAMPDDEHRPSRIEDIFGSLESASGRDSFTFPASAVHFHGEVPDGDVQVVGTDGLLRDELDLAIAEQVLQHGFKRRARPAPDFTSESGFVETRIPSGEGCRRLEIPRELPLDHGRTESRLLALSLAPGSEGSVDLDQAAMDRQSVDAMECGETELSCAGLIRDLESFAVESCSRPLASGEEVVVSPKQSSSGENTSQACGTHAGGRSSLLQSSAARIGADRVLDVTRRHFVGHVYNLDTRSDVYVAGGIVVHNCDMEVTWDATGHFRQFEIFPPAKGSIKYNYPLEIDLGEVVDLQGGIDGNKAVTASTVLGQGSSGSSRDIGYAAFPSALGGRVTEDGMFAQGSNTIESATIGFTSADEGQGVYCQEAGVLPVGATIDTVIDSTHATFTSNQGGGAILDAGPVGLGIGGIILDEVTSALSDLPIGTLQGTAEKNVETGAQTQFLPTARQRADGPTGLFGNVFAGDVVPVSMNYGWLTFDPVLMRVATVTLYPPTEEMECQLNPIPVGSNEYG